VTTGFDGCGSDINVNTDLFQGDYIEASFQHQGRTYRQQYQIPNGLIEQTYSYSFFLNLPKHFDRGAMEQEQ